MTPRTVHTRTAAGGVRIAFVRRPATGDGPHLVLVHGAGFCKEIWDPMTADLDAAGFAGAITALDLRGHGDSDRSEPPLDWRDLGRDVLTVIADVAAPVVGVGHSAGAASLVLAERVHPGRFAGLVLIEPIIMKPPHGRSEDSALANLTMRRRFRFASLEDVRANFVGKPPFSAWRPDVLDAYVVSGFRSDGDAWVLKCDPADEAEYYRSGGDHDAWYDLPALRDPVTLMAGAESNTHPPEFVAELAEQIGSPQVVIVPKATHFLPMERPDAVVEAVMAVVGAARQVPGSE